MIQIRRYEQKDWGDLWPILKHVFRLGETYPYSPEITEEESHNVWVVAPAATFVALNESNEIVGTYYIKPNQPGLGSHVCNCGYIVSASNRSKGIGVTMCEHSQEEARKLGFRSMQFNLVVSDNKGAVRLWKKLGFRIIGTLPGAFRHKKSGYVDALVMYKQLITP